MAVRNVAHPSTDDRRATGGQVRERTPPSGHAEWVPAADRPGYQQFVTAIRSGQLEAFEGV